MKIYIHWFFNSICVEWLLDLGTVPGHGWQPEIRKVPEKLLNYLAHQLLAFARSSHCWSRHFICSVSWARISAMTARWGSQTDTSRKNHKANIHPFHLGVPCVLGNLKALLLKMWCEAPPPTHQLFKPLKNTETENLLNQLRKTAYQTYDIQGCHLISNLLYTRHSIKMWASFQQRAEWIISQATY